jgi:general secretion pathway protein G
MRLNRTSRAFTLIELLVVFAIIATLLTLVAPRYFKSIDRAKETALKENLVTMRDALDKYHGDTGRYPATLEDLVTSRYLRRVPLDPIADSETSWIIIAPADASKGAVYNVKSGATGNASNGVPYADF